MSWPISNMWDSPAKHSGVEKTQEKSSLFRSMLEIVPPSAGRWDATERKDAAQLMQHICQGLTALGHHTHDSESFRWDGSLAGSEWVQVEQLAQGCVQSRPENFQGWRSHSSLPVPCQSHPFPESMLESKC